MIKSKIKSILTRIFPLLSCVVPKKKGLWIFGAWQGYKYSDNSKYMFEYIIVNHPEIDAVWITRNSDIVSKLNSEGKKAYMRFSFRGIIACLRAEMAFVTEGDQDISPFLNNDKTISVQLWHGFPLKALKWKTKDGKRRMKPASRMNKYHWISCSQECSSIMSKLLGIYLDRFVETGFPRNDTFITRNDNSDILHVFNKYPGKKFIIYMPTHRNFGSKGLADFINIEAFLELDRMLENNSLIMVYKPHFHELKKFLEFENQFTNIIFAKDSMWDDVYSYLHMFDLLISDYSSVLVDFICGNKPIVYFPYDLEDYKKNDAGLNEIFWTKPLGPMCFSWEEVIKESVSLLSKDRWKSERDNNLPFYQSHNDGKNCERVYKFAVSLRK